MDYDKLNESLNKGSKKTMFYVAVVPVNSQGQVLVAERKSDGIWTTPAGGAEGNETPEQAAIRECWEESGLVVIPSMLESLGVKMAPNGKPCHCFMVRTDQSNFSVKMDPDREVAGWNWHSRETLPEGFSRQKNANRLETISHALMKFYGLTKSVEESLIEKLDKGGPGSGVQGHQTAKKPTLRLVKPGEQLPVNKVQAHLDMLQNGGVLPGVHTVSGKPIVNDMDAARAHGYKVEDYTDAMNVHYNMAQKVNQQIEKMRMAGKQPPKEAVQISKFHQKKMKEFMAARDRLEERQNNTESAIDRKKKSIAAAVKKSTTQMGGGLGDRDLDIGNFAQTQSKADDEWMERLHVGMQDFGFGDEPRSFQLPKGILHLCKVDDGLYSGYFTNQELVGDGMLEDNAKVRIERQTIPELVMFMMAKEWITNHLVAQQESEETQTQPLIVEEPASIGSLADDLAVQAVEQKLSLPAPHLDQRLRMLELISKLIG